MKMTSNQTISWKFRAIGALLCLAVVAIHVIDQGGFPGSKSPVYIGYGYYLLEIIGLVTTTLLLFGRIQVGGFLAIGVAAGPFIGYLLSRGPGLPYYSDDIGNWMEPLGLVSLVVEGALLFLSVVIFLRSLRGNRACELP